MSTEPELSRYNGTALGAWERTEPKPRPLLSGCESSSGDGDRRYAVSREQRVDGGLDGGERLVEDVRHLVAEDDAQTDCNCNQDQGYDELAVAALVANCVKNSHGSSFLRLCTAVKCILHRTGVEPVFRDCPGAWERTEPKPRPFTLR